MKLFRNKAQERLDFIDSVRKNNKLLEYPKNYTREDLEKLDWAKYKILVPNENEKEKVQMALKYLHDSDINTNIVWVNQIVHTYEEGSPLLIVNEEKFNEF